MFQTNVVVELFVSCALRLSIRRRPINYRNRVREARRAEMMPEDYLAVIADRRSDRRVGDRRAGGRYRREAVNRMREGGDYSCR
jgi:hypothetical protein